MSSFLLGFHFFISGVLVPTLAWNLFYLRQPFRWRGLRNHVLLVPPFRVLKPGFIFCEFSSFLYLHYSTFLSNVNTFFQKLLLFIFENPIAFSLKVCYTEGVGGKSHFYVSVRNTAILFFVLCFIYTSEGDSGKQPLSLFAYFFRIFSYFPYENFSAGKHQRNQAEAERRRHPRSLVHGRQRRRLRDRLRRRHRRQGTARQARRRTARRAQERQFGKGNAQGDHVPRAQEGNGTECDLRRRFGRQPRPTFGGGRFCRDRRHQKAARARPHGAADRTRRQRPEGGIYRRHQNQHGAAPLALQDGKFAI